MLRAYKIIILCIFLSLNLSIFAGQNSAVNDELVRTSVQALMKKNKIPGAAVLLYSKGQMHSYYFGYAVPKKRILVSESSIFELGSITKTFTGLLLAENIVSGKMKLNSYAARYLKTQTSDSFKNITMLELATHTASLPFNVAGLRYNVADSEKYILLKDRFLRSWHAPFLPGSKVMYSNFGFGILGELLAASALTSLQNLMEIKILKPLQMNTAGLNVNWANKNNLVQGFTAEGKPTHYHMAGLLGGAWSMRASPKDMRAYLKAALMLPSTPEPIRQAMKVAQTPYYQVTKNGLTVGMGWMIMPLNKPQTIQNLVSKPRNFDVMMVDAIKVDKPHFNSNALIAKTGTTDGFRAYMAIIPKTQTGIVIMINRCIYAPKDMINLANKIVLQAGGFLH